MNATQELAQHLRQVYFGGNWTSVNLQKTLEDVSWQQATKQLDSLNTIAMLAYHINYYVLAISRVLQNNPIEAHDKYSFDCPKIDSQQDWHLLKEKIFTEAETLAVLIEQLPDNKLGEVFVLEKYGTYHRNLLGLIEHTHYHLGQIVIIKKLLVTDKF